MTLVNSTPTAPVFVNGEPLEYVEEFTSLGSLISKDSLVQKGIKTRLNKAQSALSQLRPIWRSKQYSLKTKMLLHNNNVNNVKYVQSYSSECWQAVKANMRK